MNMDKRILKSVVTASLLFGVGSILFTGCGGDGNGTTSGTTYSGTVSDGYIAGATVCLDLNNNGICDSTEPIGTTNGEGAYTLSTTQTVPANAKLLAYGGVDTFTNESFVGTLATPIDLRDGTNNHITPFTTLVSAKIDNGGTTTENAIATVATEFGVDGAMIKGDVISKLNSGTTDEKTKAATALKQIFAIQKTVEMLKADSNVTTPNIFKAIAKAADLNVTNIKTRNVNLANVSQTKIQEAIDAIRNMEITSGTTREQLKTKQKAIQIATEMTNAKGTTTINGTLLTTLEGKIGASNVNVSALAHAFKDETVTEINDLNVSNFNTTGKTVTIDFDAIVGEQGGLVCSENGVAKVYTGFGTANTSGSIADFRYFVSDFNVVFDDNTTEKLKLINNANQFYDATKGSVAILDFEDGTGACTGRGNDARMNKSVVGTIISTKTIKNIEFSVGVPATLNHLQFSDLSKLAKTSMDWNWAGGRKFTKLEVNPVDANNSVADIFPFHLGSTGCSQNVAGLQAGNTQTCTQPNRVPMSFTMNPATQKIVLNYLPLMQYVDVRVNQNLAAGCMSGLTDKECMHSNGKMLNMIGLDDATGLGACLGGDCTTNQKLFSVKTK